MISVIMNPDDPPTKLDLIEAPLRGLANTNWVVSWDSSRKKVKFQILSPPSVIQCYFLIYSEKGSPRKYRITSINETTSDPLIFNRFGMWRCFTFSPLWRRPKNNSTLLHETFLSHLTQCNVSSLRWNLYRPALSGIGETIDMQCGRGNDIVVDYLTWNH